jgi:hypothetical protein
MIRSGSSALECTIGSDAIRKAVISRNDLNDEPVKENAI